MMGLHWVESATFGVISVLVVVTTTVESNARVTRPVGPKMCNRDCDRTFGCSSYQYTPLDLSCRLTTGSTSPGQQSSKKRTYFLKLSKDKQRLQAEKTLNCRNDAKIFHTRRNILACRRVRLNKRKEQPTRLLLVATGSHAPQIAQQLYLRNKSLATYPYISYPHIHAIKYIPFLRTFMIAPSGRRSFVLASLDGESKDLIPVLKPITAITVDDKRQHVFLTMFGIPEIKVMATDTEIHTFRTLSWKPQSIVVDSERQVIYATRRNKYIRKLPYDSENGSEIIMIRVVFSHPTLDTEKNILYFIKSVIKRTLYKYFLSNGTFDVIHTPFKFASNYFDIFQSNIYVIPHHNRSALSVLSENGNEITTIYTGFQAETGRVFVCAIP